MTDQATTTTTTIPAASSTGCESCAAIKEALHAHPLYIYAARVTAWKDTTESGLVFAIISLFFYLITSGGYTIITLFSYILLAFLLTSVAYVQGLTLFAKFVKKTQGPTENPLAVKFKSLIKLSLTREDLEPHLVLVELVINEFFSSLYKAFSVTDIKHSLKFAFGLWVASFIGNCSPAVILYIVIVCSFIWPRLYEAKKKEIDQLATFIRQKMNTLLKEAINKLPPQLKSKLE